jgi:hypothetical protein
MDPWKRHADLSLREFARGLETVPGGADRHYPGWRNVLDATA